MPSCPTCHLPLIELSRPVWRGQKGCAIHGPVAGVKGDVPGHEFHGNQYGGAAPGKESLDGEPGRAHPDGWTGTSLSGTQHFHNADHPRDWSEDRTLQHLANDHNVFIPVRDMTHDQLGAHLEKVHDFDHGAAHDDRTERRSLHDDNPRSGSPHSHLDPADTIDLWETHRDEHLNVPGPPDPD